MGPWINYFYVSNYMRPNIHILINYFLYIKISYKQIGPFDSEFLMQTKKSIWQWIHMYSNFMQKSSPPTSSTSYVFQFHVIKPAHLK